MSPSPVGHFRAYGPQPKFREDTLKAIAQISVICEQYEGRGRVLTLRGLYYQLVARNLVENTDGSYNRVKGLVGDGRLAGLISWTAIEDLGRNVKGLRTWETPEQLLLEVPKMYRRDKWSDQKFHPEVWMEKQAVEGVVGQVCDEIEVDFLACKGYISHSEIWRAGQRFAQRIREGRTPIVFYLGDHDPSGMQMVEDHQNRLGMFAGVPIQVVRIALNMPQIERYQPPPQPAKTSDSRYEGYVADTGLTESWELDALTPDVMHEIVRDAVRRIRDEKVWEASCEQENTERQFIADRIGEPTQEDKL